MAEDVELLQQRLAEAEAEVARLRAVGTSALAGPGTPEHFFAVGGVGDPVPHPETREPLLNAQGHEIIQEHPSVEADAMVAAAERQLVSAEAALEDARTGLTAAREHRAGVDDRYAEIVAHLVAHAGGTE